MLNAAENREKTLLAEVARGNEAAFAALFHLYRARIYSFVFRMSGSAQSAEDVTQDIFAKIWQTRAGLVKIENFNAYIFRIARNRFLNIMKRMAKETLIMQHMEKKSSRAEEAYEMFERKELGQLFHFAIEELPQKQKQVFRLSKEQGMKQEEISEQLSISVVTVKSHMTQAFRTLRKKLKSAAYFITIITLATVAELFI